MEPYDDIAESVQPATVGDILPTLPPVVDVDSQSITSESAGNSCRICRGDATEQQPLFHPCKCSGSIRYVHQECLIEWLSHSKKKYCELCKTPFRFTKIYDQSMPATLPWPLFAHQLGVHVVSTACRWARYVLVAAVWLIALPWCIRQVWRGLFWLADGSWVPEAQHRMRTANETAQIQNTTAARPDLGEGGAANTLSVAFSSFMRFLAGESVAAKILRILFSVPPVILGREGDEQESRRPRSTLLHRPASLLSDVNFIKNATTPGLGRNVSIDVLEGLLICLGLVAGFVLVFLIREWVINQQPAVNEVDGQAARQPDAIDDARRQRGIRRHRPRRAGRDGHAEAAVVIPPVAGPARGIRPRALTDDNIGAPATQNPGRPDLPVRAQSLVIAPFRPTARNTAGYIDPNAAVDGDLPPPLLRGMVGEALDARRALEEAVSNETADNASSTGALHGSPIVSEAGSDAVLIYTDDTHLLNPAAVTEAADAAIAGSGNETNADTQHSDTLDFGDRPTTSGDSNLSAQIPSPTSDANVTADPAADDVVVAPSTDVEPLTTPSNREGADLQQPVPQSRLTGLVQSAEHFFWFVDGVPDPDLHQDLPPRDEPEATAEAPFVPAQHRGVALLPEDLDVVPPPTPVEADPAPQAPQFDFNDPDALEDAEDLEGIMELVGMEGPLIGMVQNVVFSLLLISLTLAVAVWIPYIWGKIALILLANPVAVIFKAPLYIVTSCVDLIADICFFVLGLCGIFFNILTKTVKATTEPILPAYAKLLDTETFEQMAVNVTHQSGSRLEKTLREAIVIFSPDLPTFSMQSHRALIMFKASFSSTTATLWDMVAKSYTSLTSNPWSVPAIYARSSKLSEQLHKLPALGLNLLKDSAWSLRAALRPQLQPLTLDTSSAHDLALVEWSTQDKILAIIIGYIFFACSGIVFMKFAHFFLGLKRNEKVEGQVADRLREAGGVLKVIIIIGIEMIVFPLYCGLLFDIAMLPLFEGATLASRLAFIATAPFTGLFLHWFAGTCYMFHFALFVSMCRKILRKGVLYFIRDPDDPTFHPVRDVLERPVPMQLGKIAFSALVYGGLVIVCLGGVVWSVAGISNVLPIRWMTDEPRLAFPLDVVFYNLGVPFLLRKTKPSEKIAAAYEWWFRGTAHGLRLSHFLFNEDRKDEKRPATIGAFSWTRAAAKGVVRAQEGTYVRAPASDSCRIPKDRKTFLEVTADNKRKDGLHDDRHGLHGRKNTLFGFFWLPPHFRARIATFVVLLWMFAAGTGIACTIGPLIVGRKVIQIMSGTEQHVNDLYSLTIGVHLLAITALFCLHVRTAYRWTADMIKNSVAQPSEAVLQIWKATKYTAGMLYLGITFGITFPFVLSFITELYIHVPIFAWYIDRERFIAAAPGGSDASILSAATTLTDSASMSVATKTVPPIPPTVFILQTWTLGLLYFRILLRIAMSYPCRHTRMATALLMITRDGGFLRPNVWLATRAVVLPLSILCTIVLFLPLALAQLCLTSGVLPATRDITLYYRLAYPATASLCSAVYWAWQAKVRLAVWRSLVRDEVYLVGERLHNYAVHAATEETNKRRDKGKGKALEQATADVSGNEGGRADIPGMEAVSEEETQLGESALLNDW